MTTLVKSLYRLYNSSPKRVTKEKLQEMLKDGKITSEDYMYITNEDPEEKDNDKEQASD